MKASIFKSGLAALLLLCVLAFGATPSARAQAQAPLTNEEFLALVRQLPKRPGLRDEIISEVRRRGIGFPLTSGLKSFVATKSGNDPDLRRALEEAERRKLNPEAVAPPSEAEAAEALGKSRAATLEAADAMPDFVVRQLITRAYALGTTRNWITTDRLSIAVSYRTGGERYRLLAVNGIPSGPAQASKEQSDYAAIGGTSSTGEFVTALKALFAADSKTTFKALETDTLRGRRTLVYEYDIKRPQSNRVLTYNNDRSVVVAHRGRVWVDREDFRVLRVQSAAYEIPQDFPITASTNTIDYEWVNIPGQGDYLLPSHAVLVMTVNDGVRTTQHRNDIRFRNYQKFGTELKILDEEDLEEIPEEKAPEKKP
jgi:hypothetical protein